MSRQSKRLQRGHSFRDSYRLVVACEGAKTEPDYVEGIKAAIRQSRLAIHIVSREDKSLSAPIEVVRSLIRFKSRHGRNDDLYWAVFDRDEQSWSMSQIQEAIQLCRDNDLRWAISNPFFEVWLAYHFVSHHDRITSRFSNDHAEIKRFVGEQKNHFGGRTRYYDFLVDELPHAAKRVELAGCDTQGHIPKPLCTQVNQLAAAILALG